MTETGTKTYAVVASPKPTTLVVHCSDPRFQIAFRKFIEDELHLQDGEYVPVVIRGGAAGFSHPERLPKDFAFLVGRIESLLERFGEIRQIVLINHEDCGFYHTLTDRVTGGREHEEQMLHDLGNLPGIFTRLLSQFGLNVRVYYARFADEKRTQVTFDNPG